MSHHAHLGVIGFWEEDYIFITSHQGTYNQRVITVDVELAHLASSGFSTVNLIFFFRPFPQCSFWKEVTMCSPHLRSGELCSTFSGWGSYINSLESFCTEVSGLSHLFIQSFIFIVMNHGHLLYILGYTEYYFIFLLNQL